jgi:hypothetical protein
MDKMPEWISGRYLLEGALSRIITGVARNNGEGVFSGGPNVTHCEGTKLRKYVMEHLHCVG